MAKRWSCLLAGVIALFCALHTETTAEKFRVCVVDGRGKFRKASRYCPLLDKPESQVECVLGLDRLDCLRKISKGTVDFSVFTAEDLVAVKNAQVEILLTNEMRFADQPYEYEVVAVIHKNSGISNKYDIKDKKLCHPGYGYENDWSQIISNYFEATVVPHSCISSLTLTENRIKASSEYFKAACKAGPWVNDPVLDAKLKRTYPNLCMLCDSPKICSTRDKYWGRRGPLYCLTDGQGVISWARLDDVKSHFGITPGAQAASPEDYSLLCPDGTIKPIASPQPCVWIAKPWPVIGAKRSSAQRVKEFMSQLNHEDSGTWQTSLLDLIENYHVNFTDLEPVESIDSYLLKPPGFLSANSFSGCHPPRSIRLCTTSNLENAKCEWLREAASVFGVEPDIDCVKGDNKTHCMSAVKDRLADLVIVPPDMLLTAERNHNLKVLFYENVKEKNRYTTVAVVKSNSAIRSFSDLRGKKACFNVYEGMAWNSMISTFIDEKIFPNTCSFTQSVADYFGPSCTIGMPLNQPWKLRSMCKDKNYETEKDVLKCLLDGTGDVAFMSFNLLSEILEAEPRVDRDFMNLKSNDVRVLCNDGKDVCHLGWSPLAQGMIRNNTPQMNTQEMLDVFLQVDNLFGKFYESTTKPFTLFGLYDGRKDVLFCDATERLRSKPYLTPNEKKTGSYQAILERLENCKISSAVASLPSKIAISVLVFLLSRL